MAGHGWAYCSRHLRRSRRLDRSNIPLELARSARPSRGASAGLPRDAATNKATPQKATMLAAQTSLAGTRS
jgi:hypothetical protein